jgi:hypothetical protein
MVGVEVCVVRQRLCTAMENADRRGIGNSMPWVRTPIALTVGHFVPRSAAHVIKVNRPLTTDHRFPGHVPSLPRPVRCLVLTSARSRMLPRRFPMGQGQGRNSTRTRADY